MASRQERAMSFGAVADDYDRLRPAPPPEAVAWLVPDGCRIAVDLGAGTGLFTRQLARRIERVIAVEPDARMRAVLRARSPGVEVLDGRGEAIPLPDASVDGVFVSSAWHWMDPQLAAGEIARVLRDGGRFGVIWTSQDRQSGWLREIDGLARTAITDPDQDRAVWPRSRHHEVVLPEPGLFERIESASFRCTRIMDTGSAIDVLATYSRVITASDEDRSAYLDRARAVLEERGGGTGEIEVPIRSRCWRADRSPRPPKT